VGIFVNLAMEFPLPHEPAHIVAAKNKQAIEDMVRGLAEEAGAADARLPAKELCLIMEGAHVTRHVTADKQSVEFARVVVDLVITSACPKLTTHG
jgi:hypothetical protein